MSEPTAVEPSPAAANAATPAATSATAPRTGARASSPDAAAPALFEEANVSVSTTRIVVYGAPFALQGTRGIRLFQDRPHGRFAVPILIAGILLGAYGIVMHLSPAIALAVMLIVVSYLTYRFQTMRHRVLLVRDTGETEVLASSSLPFAQRVKAALDQAIAAPASPASPIASAASPSAPSAAAPTA
jgi:hypothetical protein